MIVLGLDTSTTACSAAIIDGERVLAARSEPMVRGHQERLASLVQEVMGEAGLRFDQLERIGCTVGPGSFTGLRVGMAFAKAMGLALGVPAAGVGTLEALAATVRANLTSTPLTPPKGKAHAEVDTPPKVSGELAVGLGPGFRRDERIRGVAEEVVYAAAIDARRDQVYLQAFQGSAVVVPAQAVTAAEAIQVLRRFPALCLSGSGARMLAEGLPQAVLDLTETPDPVIVARLTAAAGPEPMQPIYLRAPDAKLPV